MAARVGQTAHQAGTARSVLWLSFISYHGQIHWFPMLSDVQKDSLKPILHSGNWKCTGFFLFRMEFLGFIAKRSVVVGGSTFIGVLVDLKAGQLVVFLTLSVFWLEFVPICTLVFVSNEQNSFGFLAFPFYL